ncbi:MAG: hypothetical protein AABW67_00505 [Nanoarchaeota archaeon]
MEKDLGKIKKNETTDIIVRVDEYKGKKGLTIREFVTSEKYTGFSKSGTRIPAEDFLNFREMINSISLDEMMSPPEKVVKKDKKEEEKVEKIKEKEEEIKEEKEEVSEEIKEELIEDEE